MTTDPIVGIDLGTTNSVVAVTDAGGSALVLADDNGYAIHPSVVSFHPNGSVVVGAEAKQRRIIDPRNTVYSVKRLIGRSFRSKEVTAAATRSPFQIKEGVNQSPVIVTRAGEFAVPEISAIVLDHMRNIAKRRLGQEIGRAVITVPANFTDAQRSATATAGAIAGLTVVRVLNEPTAAALAYGHQRQLNRVIAVYDFGGGTFDITILALRDQVYEVLGTAGDSFLGGDDLDERLVDHMVATFLAKERVDLRSNEVAMQRLRAVAEQTKIELSRRQRAIVKIDEIAYGPGGAPLDLTLETTRDEFVSRVADVIDRTFPVCEEAVRTAGVSMAQIEDVVLVGGTTKMPYVRDRVTKFFGKAPRTDVNPDEAVAAGAALQAHSLERVLSSGARRPTTKTAIAPPAPPMEQMTGPPPTQTPAPPPVPGAARTTSPRLPSFPPTGEHTVDDEWQVQTAASARRVTSPMGVPLPTERKAERGTHPDRVAALPIGLPPPAAKPLGRITRPGTAPAIPPPPVPRANPNAKTLFGVPAGPAAGGSTSDLLPPLPNPGAGPQDFDDDSTGVKTRPQTEKQSFDDAATGADAPPAFTLDPLPPPATASPQQRTIMMDSGPPALGRADAAKPFDLVLPATPQQQTIMVAPVPAAAQQPTLIGQSAFAQAQPHAAAPEPPRAPVVMDVTPHSLGIGTVAGYCEELIRRNARLPMEMKRMFSTAQDRQQTVRIRVCSGESRRIDENTILGDLVLDGLEPRARGETHIEVTFFIDASGILNVRARDAKTGQEQRASLDILGALSNEQVNVARDRLAQIRR